MVFQEAIDCIVNFRVPEGIWVHDKVICMNNNFPSAEELSTFQLLLSKSMKYFKQGFIPVERRKKKHVQPGPLESLGTSHMDIH